MARIFKTDVIGFDSASGKFDKIERDLKYPDNDQVNGFGMFINSDAYREYLKKSYGPELEKLRNNINDPTVSKDNVAFDIGKTTLLMLLAQQGCEGLRFIRCRNKDDKDTLVVKGLSAMSQQGINSGVVIGMPITASAPEDEVQTEEVHGSTLRDVFPTLPVIGHVAGINSLDDIVNHIARIL